MSAWSSPEMSCPCQPRQRWSPSLPALPDSQPPVGVIPCSRHLLLRAASIIRVWPFLQDAQSQNHCHTFLLGSPFFISWLTPEGFAMSGWLLYIYRLGRIVVHLVLFPSRSCLDRRPRCDLSCSHDLNPYRQDFHLSARDFQCTWQLFNGGSSHFDCRVCPRESAVNVNFGSTCCFGCKESTFSHTGFDRLLGRSYLQEVYNRLSLYCRQCRLQFHLLLVQVHPLLHCDERLHIPAPRLLPNVPGPRHPISLPILQHQMFASDGFWSCLFWPSTSSLTHQLWTRSMFSRPTSSGALVTSTTSSSSALCICVIR